ncbi:MAG: lysophospholipase, partial [Alphaproteobacteria bacterium]|nr:lysophospholipase [Alphaproteobacteria bacterium]
MSATGWAASWTASAHGPYPAGNPSAQPEQGFALPDPAAGARDQTMRMMVRPDLWGRTIRLRFTNAFGSRPLVLDGLRVGLQAVGGTVVPGSGTRIGFAGADAVTIAPGAVQWSDPVDLPFVRDPADPLLVGRRLAVSFHLPGPTGPMTWHAKALTTGYLTAPGAGAHAADESDAAFPYTTASWFFLDMVDVAAPGTFVVAGFGDSITDGTGSTMNGDDRWTDALSHRLHALYGRRVAVVNAGIGGNRVTTPA